MNLPRSSSGKKLKKSQMTGCESQHMKGVGIDIEEVTRFRTYDPRRQKTFYQKIFTDQEIRYCMSKKDPYPHFTARFCAKEAVTKALGRTLFSLKNIEITNDAKGYPSAHIREKNADYEVAVSLSHTKEYAVAIALWLH